MVWFKYEKDKYIIALSNNNWDSYYYDEDYCFWDASVLKTIGYLVDKTKAKADPNNPNRVYVEHKGKKFYIDADDSMGITRQGEKVIMNKGVFHDKMIALYINLFYLSNHWLSSPEEAFIELDSFNDYDENIVRMSNSGFELDIEDSVKKQNYVKLKDRLSELGEDKLKIKFITPVPEEPPMGTPNLDEEKERTIDELIKKYGYTEAAQVEDIKRRVENNGLMKYPVMVYPDFLDPTFFYLRELSENYIVPSAGELTKNSVTMFQSNPAFEEAFLVGMNTEMGQELLWREYPTDQRGSYFRKFWVAAKLPEKSRLETDYYDIKKVHDWNQRLGNNHVKPNAQMLVFAIKGELMQAYPKTTIYLSSYDGQTIEMMAEASMTAWLTEDTYLVGFEGFTAQAVRGLFLTFQEDVTALQFAYVDKDTASTFQDSVVLAKTQINTPSVFLLPINN